DWSSDVCSSDLKLDEQARVGKMIDLDDRARRQLVLEEFHPRRDDFLELAYVRRIHDDGNDVRKTSARGLQGHLHVADGLTRLFRHVARADEIPIGVA